MNRHILRVFALVLLVVLVAVGGAIGLAGCGTEPVAATDSTTASTSAPSSNLLGTSPAESVAATASPSVVNVRVTGTAPSPFFGDQPYEGVGSGVIYSSDGYVITNAHVVTQNGKLADTVEVTFSSGEQTSATIVATDTYTDIAVIKVNKSGLTPATFSIDSKPTIGEYAVAIGSPLDYSNSVTLGIVSGLGRSIENAGTTSLVDLIQTDAAISPGNSGGALVNQEGRVIGINVAYMPPNTSGAENLGFAIPAATAVSVAKELIANGHASHAYLGISYASVTAALKQQYDLSRDTGVLVTALDPEGPAASGGLKEGDIITSLQGKSLTSEADMIMVLRELHPGDSASVSVDRSGQTVELTITVGERSTSTTRAT
jgi:serine protease DegQ